MRTGNHPISENVLRSLVEFEREFLAMGTPSSLTIGGPPVDFIHYSPFRGPDDNNSRIGFFLPKDIVVKHFEHACRIWSRLHYQERELILEEINGHFSDSYARDHFIDSNSELFDRDTRTLKDKWAMIFDLCAVNSNAPLRNPFDETQYEHQKLGERYVSLESAASRFKNVILLRDYNPLSDRHASAIAHALTICTQQHLGQERNSGEAYAVHPIEVAIILRKVGVKDPILIIGALLHDVGEDSQFFGKAPVGSIEWNNNLYTTLNQNFGRTLTPPEISRLANIMYAITKHKVDSKGEPLSKDESDALHFELTGQTIDTLILKCGDRLHNLLTIDARPIQNINANQYETRYSIIPLIEKYRPLNRQERRLVPALRRLYSLLHGELTLVSRLSVTHPDSNKHSYEF